MKSSADLANQDDSLAVEVRGLSKWFGQHQVLSDIDLSVRRGERIVICGPSGSGKSTLVDLILGVISPQQGELSIFGLEPKKIQNKKQESYTFILF